MIRREGGGEKKEEDVPVLISTRSVSASISPVMGSRPSFSRRYLRTNSFSYTWPDLVESTGWSGAWPETVPLVSWGGGSRGTDWSRRATLRENAEERNGFGESGSKKPGTRTGEMVRLGDDRGVLPQTDHSRVRVVPQRP